MDGLGRWSVIRRLGAGGMGEVFLARNPDGELAALKVIREEYASDPSFAARFRREVEACSRVRGERVAELVDANTTGPRPWLAVKYAHGPTLAGQVAHSGALASETVRALAIGLADALSAVWAAGIVHRDLKPSNVIMATDGPVLIDFGIATATDATAITRTGVTVGSAGWIAPEVLLGQASTPRTDVWGWGGVICFAASGSRPQGDGPAEALAWRTLNSEPDPVVLAQVPDSLRSLVEQSLVVDPWYRPDPLHLPALAAGQAIDEPTSVAATRAQRDATVTRLWLSPPPASTIETTAPGNRTPLAEFPRPATSTTDVQKRRRRTTLGVVAVLLLLGAIGAVAVAGLPDDGEGADSATTSTTSAGSSDSGSSQPDSSSGTSGPPAPEPTGAVEGFCEEFRAYDEQFTDDPDASDQEVIDAIRSLDPPPEIEADMATLLEGLDMLTTGNTDVDMERYTDASTNIQTFVDQNCL